MKQEHLTQEQRKEIYQLYMEGAPVKEISAAYDINASAVCRVAKKLGAEPRRVRPKHVGSPTADSPAPKSGFKVCPNCRKRVGLKDAIYCPYCATDIRSPRELLVARIPNVIAMTKYLPESMRDEMQKFLIDVKNELNKGV